jgi:hypothetical protein
MWVWRDARVPWVAEVNRLARPEREPGGTPGERRRRRELRLPPGTPLSPAEEREIEFTVPMTKDGLAGLLGTYSGVITLAEDQRADFFRRVGEFLGRQPWNRIDLPMICRCLRSIRLPG